MVISATRLFALTLTSLWLAIGASAACAMNFEASQHQALTYSHQLQAQDAAIRSSAELVLAAGERPDPQLTIALQNLPATGGDKFSVTSDFMTMRMVGISQELTRQNTLDLRQALQKQRVLLATTGKRLQRSDVLRGSARAWLRAYYLQAQQRLLCDELLQARLQEKASAAAYRGNALSQSEAIAIKNQVLMLEDQQHLVISAYEQARFDLSRWLGQPITIGELDEPPVTSKTHLDGVDLSEHLLRHPDLQSQSQRIELAHTAAELAEAAKSPNWTVSMSYAKRGSEFSDMLSVGVSVPLQWEQARRQDREIASRVAEVEQAQALRDDLLDRHVAEINGQLERWRSNQARVRRYRTEIIPLQQVQVSAAMARWRGGRSTVATVFSARRDLVSAQIAALTLEMQVALDWADLEFLLPDNSEDAA